MTASQAVQDNAARAQAERDWQWTAEMEAEHAARAAKWRAESEAIIAANAALFETPGQTRRRLLRAGVNQMNAEAKKKAKAEAKAAG